MGLFKFMLTSTFNKTVGHAVSNSFNSLSRVSGSSVAYTGSTRILYKNTVPSGSSISPIFRLDSGTDYFISFNATNANGNITIGDSNSIFYTLDSGNNYSLLIAAESTGRTNYIFTDNRYNYLTTFSSITIGNSGTRNAIISIEKLTEV